MKKIRKNPPELHRSQLVYTFNAAYLTIKRVGPQMSTTTIHTPSQTPVQTIAQTTRQKIKRQFSLATLLLVVLWLASGYSIWFYWQSWELVDEFPFGNAGLRYMQDGSRLLRFVDDEPVEFNAQTGKIVKRYPFKLKHDGNICISPDWERLACSVMQIENTPAHIDIYNMRTGELENTIETGEHALRFSEDGKRLFLGVYHWSLYTYQLDTKKHLGGMRSLSPAKFGGDDASPLPQLTREEGKKLDECERALFKAQTVAELDDAVNALMEIPQESTWMEVHLSPYADVAITNMAARNGSQAFVWDLAAGKRSVELKDFFAGEDMSFVFTKNAGRLAILNPCAAKAGLWDLATGDRISVWENHDTSFLAAAADGGLVLSVSSSQEDNHAHLWDALTGTRLLNLPPFKAASISPDASRIAGLEPERLLQIHDSKSGGLLCSLPAPLGRYFRSVTYAPDGRGLVVTAGGCFNAVTKIYRRNHTETEYGWLDMPVSWVFVVLSLILLWRIARKFTSALRTKHAPLSTSPPA